MTPDADILYKPRGILKRSKIGAHRGADFGAFGSFKDIVPFLSYPDARRIDIRATIHNPFDEIFVRRFEQRVSIDVYAIIDSSRSLSYQGQTSKAVLIRELCVTLARSVRRTGDRFGLVVCGADINEALFIPASNRRSIEEDIANYLSSLRFDDANANGLLQISTGLTGKRKLLFLISDFLLPDNLLRRVFEDLHEHDVIPVLVKDSAEDLALPDFGFMHMRDLETHKEQLIFMRPSVKQEWIKKVSDHEEKVARLAREHGRSLVVLKDIFDPEQFSQAILDS